MNIVAGILVSAQDRPRQLEHAAVAVVEGDEHRPRRQRLAVQLRVAERLQIDRMTGLRNHPDVLGERVRGDVQVGERDACRRRRPTRECRDSTASAPRETSLVQPIGVPPRRQQSGLRPNPRTASWSLRQCGRDRGQHRIPRIVDVELGAASAPRAPGRAARRPRRGSCRGRDLEVAPGQAAASRSRQPSGVSRQYSGTSPVSGSRPAADARMAPPGRTIRRRCASARSSSRKCGSVLGSSRQSYGALGMIVLAVREVAQIRACGTTARCRTCRRACTPRPKRSVYGVGLHFEHVAGNQIAMRRQERVKVVAIDRRAALESVGRGKRHRSPQVAPTRPSDSRASDDTRRHGGARADQRFAGSFIIARRRPDRIMLDRRVRHPRLIQAAAVDEPRVRPAAAASARCQRANRLLVLDGALGRVEPTSRPRCANGGAHRLEPRAIAIERRDRVGKRADVADRRRDSPRRRTRRPRECRSARSLTTGTSAAAPAFEQRDRQTLAAARHHQHVVLLVQPQHVGLVAAARTSECRADPTTRLAAPPRPGRHPAPSTPDRRRAPAAADR